MSARTRELLIELADRSLALEHRIQDCWFIRDPYRWHAMKGEWPPKDINLAKIDVLEQKLREEQAAVDRAIDDLLRGANPEQAMLNDWFTYLQQ